MNPTQTHKVFGQGVRGMLAVAIAASAVSTASVKAGPTEDTIAAAMNATGIVSGVTGKTVKTKDQSFNPPSSFQSGNDCLFRDHVLQSEHRERRLENHCFQTFLLLPEGSS